MQISAKFAMLFAAVAYGSISVAALPVYNQYDARAISVDLDTRDLSYLDVRTFEDFLPRDVATTPDTPAQAVPAPAGDKPSPVAPAVPAGPARPPPLTAEQRASHRAALADSTHPDHQKALERQKAVHAYHVAALADPTHPHHAKALSIEQNKKDFAHKHQAILNDPTHHLHQHALAHERLMQHKAALADPKHPGHQAALAKDARRKALREKHQKALNDKSHPDHEAAVALEAKRKERQQHMAALANPDHPGHQAAMQKHRDQIAAQQGRGAAGATEGTHPHAHEHPVGAGPASTGAKLRRRDYYY